MEKGLQSGRGTFASMFPSLFTDEPVEPTYFVEMTDGIPGKVDANGNLWEAIEGPGSPYVLTETLESRNPALHAELYPNEAKLSRKFPGSHPGR